VHIFHNKICATSFAFIFPLPNGREQILFKEFPNHLNRILRDGPICAEPDSRRS